MSIYIRSFIFICSLVSFNAIAGSDYENQQLRLMLIQLDNIDVLAKQSKSNLNTSVNDRFSFDYPQFNKDIQAIRQGILNYLEPSRAQPRALFELNTDYRINNKQGVNHE